MSLDLSASALQTPHSRTFIQDAFSRIWNKPGVAGAVLLKVFYLDHLLSDDIPKHTLKHCRLVNGYSLEAKTLK